MEVILFERHSCVYCTFLFRLTFIFYIFKNKGRKAKYRSTLILVCDMIDIAAKSFLKFAEESRIMLQTCKKQQI